MNFLSLILGKNQEQEQTPQFLSFSHTTCQGVFGHKSPRSKSPRTPSFCLKSWLLCQVWTTSSKSSLWLLKLIGTESVLLYLLLPFLGKILASWCFGALCLPPKNIKRAEALLGHSSIQIALQHYGRYLFLLNSQSKRNISKMKK